MEIEPGHIVRYQGEEKVVIDVAVVEAAESESQYVNADGYCRLATLRSPGDGDGNESAQDIVAEYCDNLEIVGRI